MAIDARGRDILTGVSGNLVEILGEVSLEVVVGQDRRIIRCEDKSGRLDLSRFQGLRLGREVRGAMSKPSPEPIVVGSLLYRAFQELPPLAFLGRGAQLSWLSLSRPLAEYSEPDDVLRTVEGLCISYKENSPSMTHDGKSNMDLIHQPAGTIATNSEDPWAWHDFGDCTGPHFLRIRRTDVWSEADDLRVDFTFQDAARAEPDKPIYRIFHEYRAFAAVDPITEALKELEALPGTLPFVTCLAAVPSIQKLIGMPVSDFAKAVPAMFAGTSGCTHLNSALQTLVDAPHLARDFDEKTSTSSDMRRA